LKRAVAVQLVLGAFLAVWPDPFRPDFSAGRRTVINVVRSFDWRRRRASRPASAADARITGDCRRDLGRL